MENCNVVSQKINDLHTMQLCVSDFAKLQNETAEAWMIINDNKAFAKSALCVKFES